MNSLTTEAGFVSLNKQGEQLCGDRVEWIEQPDGVTLVLADGLGSGVKANILSTLTAKIIATMMAEGLPVEECVRTIASTLPVCQQRQVAYSTFTILQVRDGSTARIIQFDNPSVILLRAGKNCPYPMEELWVDDKKIFSSTIDLLPEDMFVLFSDGAVYAGIGHSLAFGWGRENIISFLEGRYRLGLPARDVAFLLAEEANRLYEGQPGDDTTIAALRVRERQAANLLVGPPFNRDDVPKVIRRFLEQEGRHIVCGGTTSSLVGRYLGRPVTTSLRYYDPAIPPIGEIEGLDLVTEGVITLQRVADYVHALTKGEPAPFRGKKDGASRIAQNLMDYATDIRFYLGRASNPAHQPLGISADVKQEIVRQLCKDLRQLGKNVTLQYC